MFLFNKKKNISVFQTMYFNNDYVFENDSDFETEKFDNIDNNSLSQTRNNIQT